MEHLVRVQNESDRQILAWLLGRVGEAAVAAAARDCAGRGKPYLSQVCRRLGILPPWTIRSARLRDAAREAHEAIGEQHLAEIRQILARARPATSSSVGRAVAPGR
ncbi:hypothetical protein R69888_06373 [Paraburkholderia haematera]|uniref:Uncharacterized protein n=1 Tax=Paraburkholderia haematera TaxID=2793077 RepID=A0ABN7MSG3_9BURK|nr:hypothetical protein R69888_06373 [Paraburkholderia haematera]